MIIDSDVGLHTFAGSSSDELCERFGTSSVMPQAGERVLESGFFSPFVHVVTAASVTAVPAAGVKRKRKDLAGAVSSKVSTLTPSFETLSGFGPHLPITRQTPSPFTSSSKTAGPVAFHESTARSKGSAS